LYKPRYFSVLLIFVLFMFVLNGCIGSSTPAPKPKTILKGTVEVPVGAVKGKQITGQALSNATVNIIDPKTGNIIATATTDADGNYSVEVPAGGPYIVQAVKGNIKVLDVSPVVQTGETKNLGTADATSTAQALIFQTLVKKGENPANINLEAILNLSGFSQLVSQVEKVLEAGGDPTTNSQVNNVVNNIVSPKPASGGGGGGGGVIVKPPIHNVTKDKYYENIQEAIGEAVDNDVLQVTRGTFEIPETFEINKQIKIVGVGNRKPVLMSTTAKNPVFNIASDNVTIENFEITTNVPVFGEIGNEEMSSLIVVGEGKNNITIKSNKIYALESGSMNNWTSRGICINRNSNVTIEGNTIFNTRNGIIVKYSCTAKIKNNTVYNTKGGIMNYTNNKEDADRRTMISNSWGIAHNEWDIIWNSGGGYNPEERGILKLSKNNNNAYVVDRRSIAGNITENRSHVFVQANSGHDVAHEVKGNMNEPFSSISLGIEAVVPGGTVFLVSGNFDATINPVEITKSLTLKSLVKHGAVFYKTVNIKTKDVVIEDARFVAGDGHSIIIDEKDNIKIKGCKFDANNRFMNDPHINAIQLNSKCSNITIDNCSFRNGYYVTINGYADNLTVENCTIENCKSGINLIGGEDLKVINTDISVIAQKEDNDTYCVRFASSSNNSGNNLTVSGGKYIVDKNGLKANEPDAFHSAIIIRSGASGDLKASGLHIIGEVVNLSKTNLYARGNKWGIAGQTKPEEGQLKGNIDYIIY